MKKTMPGFRQALFIAFTLPLAGCFMPDAPPSYEFEPIESPISSSNPQCPDLSGTYRLVPDSQESKLFSPYLLPPHQMDMVQLTHSSNDWFLYRLKMHKARFVEQAAALHASNPGAYAEWRRLITQWQQVKQEKKDTSVLESDILKIGPLPERGGLLTPSQCEAFWAMVKYQDNAPIGLEDASDNTGSIETVTRLSRGKTGALVFRYDNFRMRSFIFGSNIRTGIINSAYAKLEPMQHSLFNWEVGDLRLPLPDSDSSQSQNPEAMPPGVAPSERIERELPASLPATLVNVQQYATSQLPAGANISHFLLEDASKDKALWISMKGTAKSNQDVSDFMRAIDQHPSLEYVELVSIQYTDQNKVAFEFRLKLENQTQ